MGIEEIQSNSGKHVLLKCKVTSAAFVLGDVTTWLSYSFAREWYSDALNEACKRNDHHARRREIVFAVSSSESYLLEWVRDAVLQRDFHKLETYFPAGERRPGVEKWKEIPKQLKEDGLIPSTPDLGGKTWADFKELVEYRNGLLHARASRPATDGLPPESMPLPSKGVLDKLDPGWATKVVRWLIVDLHKAVGTASPEWLEEP